MRPIALAKIGRPATRLSGVALGLVALVGLLVSVPNATAHVSPSAGDTYSYDLSLPNASARLALESNGLTDHGARSRGRCSRRDRSPWA